MNFSDILKAGEMATQHAAAMIYHDVAAITADVQQWEANNPAVAALLNEGVDLAKKWLETHGIPVHEVVILADDVVGFLKRAAVADTDIPTPTHA